MSARVAFETRPVDGIIMFSFHFHPLPSISWRHYDPFAFIRPLSFPTAAVASSTCPTGEYDWSTTLLAVEWPSSYACESSSGEALADAKSS